MGHLISLNFNEIFFNSSRIVMFWAWIFWALNFKIQMLAGKGLKICVGDDYEISSTLV